MLEFDEQLSRLQKPDREEMTDEEYAVFNKNVEVMEKNWGFINNLFKILPLNAKEYIGFLNFKNSLYNDTCYLTDAQKEYVTKLGVLEEAETVYGMWAKGDINMDGVINMVDLSVLLSSYGTDKDSSDIDGSGTVDSADLSILLSNYGTKIA